MLKFFSAMIVLFGSLYLIIK